MAVLQNLNAELGEASETQGQPLLVSSRLLNLKVAKSCFNELSVAP